MVFRISANDTVHQLVFSSSACGKAVCDELWFIMWGPPPVFGGWWILLIQYVGTVTLYQLLKYFFCCEFKSVKPKILLPYIYIYKIIFMAHRYVQCSCFDRTKRDTSLVSTLFVLQTFLFKRKVVSYFCKLTHIWFLTTENMYILTIYSWSHIEIPISLEPNHIGP